MVSILSQPLSNFEVVFYIPCLLHAICISFVLLFQNIFPTLSVCPFSPHSNLLKTAADEVCFWGPHSSSSSPRCQFPVSSNLQCHQSIYLPSSRKNSLSQKPKTQKPLTSLSLRQEYLTRVYHVAKSYYYNSRFFKVGLCFALKQRSLSFLDIIHS